MRDLNGKVAVVTGAASGIGLAVAERLAREGMAVAMADIEEAALDAAAQRVAGAGASVLPILTDVSDRGSVEHLAARAAEELGPVYLVHNNAGVESMGSLSWQTPPAAWDWVLAVNLGGVLNGIQTFVPGLIARGDGYIVNTASMAGLIAMPGLASYAASKAAVVSLSETLYHELRAVGSPVGVSVLVPSLVNTNLMDAQRNWPEAELGPRPALDDEFARHVRTGATEQLRASGMAPNDVAAMVVDAVFDDRFWVFTHAESTVMFTDRFDRASRGAAPALPAG